MSQSDNRTEQDKAGVPGDTEAEEIGFAAAMGELASIVSELESDLLDVDVLAERVERAALLVGTCRDRLDATKLRVEEIIVRLDNSQTTATPATGLSGSEVDEADDRGDVD